MNVLPDMLLISLCLAGLFVLFFMYLFKQQDYDQSDRMSLVPLKGDDNALPSKKK